ncbi:hypothetical protein QAD02_016671 [Eretmocerus hayati]|uniref:Uncharacterized protein n=1 Tax=Eretmocerus hayati TaxID=131215 RepID=A0ACC2PE91_9HYME|nr:hypothetical protein QAD02_016671 [Eretmocerus hayati]
MFHVRRRPADYVPRKRKKKPSGKWNELEHRYEDERLPFLQELNPDGTEIANGAGIRHRLQPNVTEVGSERPIGPQAVQAQTITLTGPTVMPRHCVIAFTENIVTLTPCSRDAHTYVNNQRIHQTTILQSGAIIKFGRMHTFRFIDPAPEERIRQRLDSNRQADYAYDRLSGYERQQQQQQPRGTDPILPAVLEFLEETEETFLHAVITDVEPSAPQFKLAPTYTLYLAARYRASTHYRPELQPTERAHRLTIMLANVATMIKRVIQERYMDASSLALWLANGSELLHMLKSDRHVGAFSTRAQDILAEAVHAAFDSLVRCVSLELAPAMSQFMADADEPAKEAGVLQIFSNTMALLRRCRVNAALTIQLFSHLFHTINATAFNALVSNGNLCVRWFGRRLKARLNALETWAERQGLELASQCHLATIMQATHLLQAPKYNADELATLSSTCFKLNSLQVRALLQKYHPADDEPTLPPELIENVVRVAESVADTLARADGREIRLEEEPTLNLALLLPEDGYSCEVIRGVPPGLAEFLAPLQRDGLCRMAAQPTSSGYWTIYMIDHFRSPSAMSNRSLGYPQVAQTPSQPEIQIIKLHKSSNGMGLSIVAAKGAGQEKLGIYIKSVVAGGAADADGRLSAGDQLLKVDGQSLVGITQEKAAEYLVRTGPIVTLEVAKQGAIYHGLATLLSQPSPIMTRDVGNEGKLQHEVFNPGYSRASSSNSVTPPVQPPPMPAMNGATSLRSRSSQNLHDPSRGALPPSGLANRQQSSPNLNPSNPSNMQNNLQGNESERFYQNLSVYRNQDGPLKQQSSPAQSSDDRSPLHGQKPLSRGSESSLNRGPNDMNPGNKERPMSAYVGPQQQQQLQQQGYPGHPMQQQQPPQQGAPVRSQSSRDIIRQEAKLQEMQEEVRRRELRGPGGAPAPAPTAYRSNTYNPRLQPGLLGPQQQQQQAQQNSMRGRPMGSTPNLGPNSPNYNRPGYGYPDPASQQYAQQQQYNQFGKQAYGNNAMQAGRGYGQPQQNGPLYSNGPEPMQHSETDLGVIGENPPARPALPHSNAGTPPPPVPNTLTHPLYAKQMDASTRYTASMQDPPRGGYYPANSSSQQPRQYQFSATDPWQREEREKEQARRREAARQWRDQQIAELSGLSRRTPQQEEQLRALQLERDFQKRAEEAASQQDDEEEGNDVDNEATSQRVQNLFRNAAAQDRGNHMPGPTGNGHPALTRSGPNNQSGRGALSPQSVNSQIQMTNVPIHTVSSSQQQPQSNPVAGSYHGQNDLNVSAYNNQNHNVNNHQSSPYGGGSLNHSNASQKASQVEAEQRRIDEFKRRQSEFDESQRRRQEEEAVRQQQQQMQAHQAQMQQQMYQQHQSNLRNQQQVHPGMLRLDNLIIEDPSSPNSQNNIEAPPPPERGSSYAVMSQQSALRSNTSTTSNSLVGPQSATMTKRVSFHDPNANTESPSRNNISNSSNLPSSITMDTIREDPNNFINDAEMLLASPKTPEGPGGLYQGATPGVIGAQEVYKDPRQKRLAEKQRQQQNSQMGPVPEKLTFKEKMKLFAIETGEDGTPRDKVKISRAQREIDNIGSPLSSNNNN